MPSPCVRSIVVVLLLSLSGCASSAGEPGSIVPGSGPASLRVVSFNLDGDGGRGDHSRSWPLREEGIVSRIESLRPHLLGVQEVFRPQLDALATALPGFAEVGVGSLGGERGEYTALLYDRARLELMGGGTFWISEFPETPGSRHFGNVDPRTATWGRFRDLETNMVFVAVNVRLDDVSEPSREMGVEVLQDRILSLATAAGSVVLMGDFGAGEEARSNRVIRAASVPDLQDTFRLIHPDATSVGTFHGHGEAPAVVRRDAILSSPQFRVVDAGIAREPGVDGAHPSDHHPVWAELEGTPPGGRRTP
jgi:endonuclease/exonuclease/phosphatase family metal-dependent hydrolase